MNDHPLVVAGLEALPHLPILERALASEGEQDFAVETAGTTDDASRIAASAIRDGGRFLIAAGGDQTLSAIVNGMMTAVEGPDKVLDLGIVPAGSDSDFARTFGLPADTAGAARHLFTGNYYELDLARVTYRAGSGAETRYCANLAQIGLGAAITSRARKLPRWLGGAGRLLAFWTATATYRIPTVSVAIGRKGYEGRTHNVVVANCQFTGGGYRVSPRSYPGDGVLDVLVMRGPRSDAFTMLPAMWRGEHIPSDRIVELRGKEIRIDAVKPQPVELDGVTVGTTPVIFEVVPKALRLRV